MTRHQKLVWEIFSGFGRAHRQNASQHFRLLTLDHFFYRRALWILYEFILISHGPILWRYSCP